MPWKSDVQRRWGNSPSGKKALGGQAKVDEWNQASKGMKFPEKKKRLPRHIHRVTEK